MEYQVSQPMMSDTIGELADALSKAQAAMTGALKDSNNPFFKSKYADLKACVEAAKEPLAKNNLAVAQTTIPDKDGVICVSTLMHKSGEWIRGSLFLPSKKQDDPQQFGSALTYARRYGFAAIVGLVQEDDDANAAPRPTQQQKAPAKDNKRIAQEKLYEAIKNFCGKNTTIDKWNALAREIVKKEIRDFSKLTIKECEAGINILKHRKEEK